MSVCYRILPALFAIAGFGLSASSAGSSESQLLEGVGLTGRWAQNCLQPAQSGNPYLIYDTPANAPPTEQYVVDSFEPRVSELLDVKIRKDGKLEWVQAEGETMLTIVTLLQGNRLRTWSSSATLGNVSIANGKFAEGGSTPWYNKCETN